jgi:hypothetical protein
MCHTIIEFMHHQVHGSWFMVQWSTVNLSAIEIDSSWREEISLISNSSTDRQSIDWSSEFVDRQTIGQPTGEFVDGQTIGQLTGEFVDGQTIGQLTGEFVDGQKLTGE